MAENNPFPGENNTGHIWDDNLRELKNPPPRWWMIAFWASIAWWVAYGILYPMWPGIKDATEGLLGWSSIQEYKDSVAEVEAVRAKYEEGIAAASPAEILASPELSAYVDRAAKVLFGDNCASCHGSGGQGNVGFPVLADDNWLFGGTIDDIVNSITNGRGRNAIVPSPGMPSHANSLKPEEIDKLADYVIALSEGGGDEEGKNLYITKGCAGCHGMDARGLKPLGSANLTDAIWRFLPAEGQTLKESVVYTITHGVNAGNDPQTREAVMPSFKDRLDENDIKKLAVYVHRLGGGQ